MIIKVKIICILSVCLLTRLSGQSFFVPSDTLNKPRVYAALGVTATVATSISLGLYHTWYSKFEKSSFHFFNDWGEWRHMDKAGHIHTAYFQGYLTYKGARWTGLNKKTSLLTGIICSTLFQGTVEMFDAYSAKWGFSVTDLAANLTGTTVFALQEHFWNEQRIKIKISSIPNKYSNTLISSTDGLSKSYLSNRANELFGDGLLERFLKDYNAQTYWASINVQSLLPTDNRWPKWLNIAVGYGAENLFGGFDNSWTRDGKLYTLNPNDFPRMSQFFISPDIDFTKIKTKSPFLKSLFTGLNIFKMPSPAIEFNTQGQVVFHLFK